MGLIAHRCLAVMAAASAGSCRTAWRV